MAAISNDWLPALKPEFGKDYYKELYRFINSEYRTAVIYPPADRIFEALHLTPDTMKPVQSEPAEAKEKKRVGNSRWKKETANGKERL